VYRKLLYLFQSFICLVALLLAQQQPAAVVVVVSLQALLRFYLFYTRRALEQRLVFSTCRLQQQQQ